MTYSDEIRRAIALGYEPGSDRAPKVLAKGLGQIAEAILAIARKHEIHIHQDSALARSLYILELGQEIPEEFYVAVAEVLAFIYRVDKELRRRKGFIR
jgi:flagellar biosynthesis protein